MAPLSRFADHLRFRRHADIGRRGEDRAHRYLRSKGFIVVARNWRPPQGGGEIDLIARQNDRTVFVEVKSRVSPDNSAPERDIDPEKIHALRRAARDYLRRSGTDPEKARFDVIAITGSSLNHLPDAFPL